jgi:hypothetical protein
MGVQYSIFTTLAKEYEYMSWHVFTSSILALWIFGAENCTVWGPLKEKLIYSMLFYSILFYKNKVWWQLPLFLLIL